MEPPDNIEKGIRFGCGAVAGVALAITSMLSISIVKGWYLVAFVCIWAVVCGVAAMRYGDKFWHNISKWRL